jgi:hypothetical protein
VTPFWAPLVAGVSEQTRNLLKAEIALAEARRGRARYNTGTIPEASVRCLRGLTARVKPKVAIEIGTFIGTSAAAMVAGHIYTCDLQNDCLPRSPRITPHPLTKSTSMLGRLVTAGVRAEFFFFDGRLRDGDVDFVLHLAQPGAVFAFDDYEGQEKGVLNVDRIRPLLTGYRLELPAGIVDDLEVPSTIAALVPEGWA